MYNIFLCLFMLILLLDLRSNIYGKMFDLDSIKYSTLFKNISDTDFYTLCSELTPVIRAYAANETIQIQGEVVEKIGIIMDGKVMSIKYHYDGTSQILQNFRKNDIIGLEAVSSTFFTSLGMLITETDCIIVYFKYSDIFSCKNLPEQCKITILQNMNNILSDENIKFMYKIDVLSKRTIRERITTYLSFMSEKRNSKTVDIGMNQEQFAQYLCTNRSALSKELNSMRREGLISFNKSVYTIYNL